MGLGYIIKDYSLCRITVSGRLFMSILYIRCGTVFILGSDLSAFYVLAGVSVPYSVGRGLESGNAKSELLYKAIKRGILLILIGLYIITDFN